MDEIAQAAQLVLQHIKLTREIKVDDYITGFINQVRQYALSAQRDDAVALAVTQALETQCDDTTQAFTCLNERMKIIEKATASSPNTHTTISASQPVANWQSFRNTKEWQRGLIQATVVSARSNGSSSPGVPKLELQEDRELTIKVSGANCDQLRLRTPRELVEQAQRQREAVAKLKNSAPLAGGGSGLWQLGNCPRGTTPWWPTVLVEQSFCTSTPVGSSRR